MYQELGSSGDDSREKLINYVVDLPGHDRRYAIDVEKIESAFKLIPHYSFEQELNPKRSSAILTISTGSVMLLAWHNKTITNVNMVDNRRVSTFDGSSTVDCLD
jgi:hypothetical protein